LGFSQKKKINDAQRNASNVKHMSELIVENLRKSYKTRTVVQDISLKIHSGEIIGLLGPNGAGKTTSFYMMVGLVPLDAGRILLNGKDLSRLPIHSRARMGLSYLPQEPSIFRKMTVTENIMAVLELQGLTEEEQEAQLESLLQELHIVHIRNSMAVSLSGGERRRVEIARCLATNPSFILLDEPFAGIDPIAVLDIQKIIRFLSSKNIGILITDHNVRETLGICDRAYIVNDGTVFASGSPDEIVKDEAVREVYLGRDFRL
jgi:lipopolysaccharide export system ATP-binding protein